MRWAGFIAMLLILLILLAGCGQRIPIRNTTSKNPWTSTPTPKRGTGVSATQTPVINTTSPILRATVIPSVTSTGSPIPTYRSPPPATNLTANFTVIDEKILAFSYNRTAYTYNLENPPLLIDYTLTVPNITKTRVVTDPVSGNDEEVTITYPDPVAAFEVTVKDTETNRVLVKNGYGGQYDVSYSKQIWVRYPGNYYIEFFGNRVTADVKFLIPRGS
jgi:hypothetical protein